jgi:hypothetical protein
MKMKIFLITCSLLLLISSVSAINFDNVKEFSDNGKYGKVEIKNLWGIGSKIIDLELTENTFECGDKKKCEAIIPITLYEEGSLVEDIRFMVEKWSGVWSEGTIQSYKLEFYDGVKWKNYNLGDILPAGDYTLRIEGKKKKDKVVDWQIKTNGFWINEWAIWGKQLFLQDNFDDSSINGSLWIQNDSTTGTPTWAETSELRLSSSSASGDFNDYVFLQGNSSETNLTNLTTLEIGIKIKNNGARKIGYVSIVDVDNSSNYLSFGVSTETNIGAIISYGNSDPNSIRFLNGANFTSTAGSVGTFYDLNITFTKGVAYLNTTLGNLSYNLSNLLEKTIRIDVGAVGRAVSGETPDASFSDLVVQNNLDSLITLDSPANNFNSFTSTLEFNCSATQIDATIKNISLFTNQSGTFESVNSTTGLNGNTNSSSFNHNLENVGNYLWNCYVCDSDESCAFAINNNTVQIKSFNETNVIANSTTLETASETFAINVSSKFATLVSAKFYYDGEDKGTSTLTGNSTQAIFSNTIDIPTVTTAGSKNFFWEITTSLDVVNTTSNTITVNKLTMAQCNSTLNVPYLNLTFKNETLSEESITATLSNSMQYYLGSGSANKTLTYINATEQFSYSFCSDQPSKTLNVDYDLTYNNANSQQRIFSEATTLTNNTKNLTLFLLPTSAGIFVTFQVINSAEQPVSGASANVSRNGVVILSGLTNDAGTITYFLNPDQSYSFDFVKTGVGSFSSAFLPTETSYTINLGGAVGVGTTPEDYTKGIVYTINPKNASVGNVSAQVFDFTITSSFWELESFGFILKNSTGGSFGSVTSTSSTGGTVSLTNSTLNLTGVTMDFFWVIASNNTNGSRSWIVINTGDTEHSMVNFFRHLGLYINAGIFGIDDFGRALITFIFIFLFTGVMSLKFGLRSQEAIMGLIFSLVLFFDVGTGIMPNPVGAIDNFPSIIMGLILLAILLREGINR